MCSPLIFGAALSEEMEALLVARLAGTDALSELVDAALQGLWRESGGFQSTVAALAMLDALLSGPGG